jgi:molybdopterin converting factor small subunit
MKIRVKIYAGLRQYVSDFTELTRKDDWEVAGGTTIGEVIEMLNFPKSLQILIMVNGVHSNAKERRLTDGDSILLYPLMGGG